MAADLAMDNYIKFQFDYNCPPIWLVGWRGEVGPRLVSSEGCFVDDPEYLSIKVFDNRLKGEVELEQKAELIYDIYCRIWDINEFPAGEPYLGFASEQEKNEFYEACEYVIKRMKELFGDEFVVYGSDEKIIKERLLL